MIHTQEIELKNGSFVTLREIRSDDAPRIIALFRRLSLETIRYRFFTVRSEPTPAEAELFATVDYTCRIAVVVTLPGADDEEILGIAQYDSAYASEIDQAEFAIVVRDDYQHFGLGRLMLKQLVDLARASGLSEIFGTVQSDNQRMLRFLSSSGHPVKFEYREGELYFIMDLGSTARVAPEAQARAEE